MTKKEADVIIAKRVKDIQDKLIHRQGQFDAGAIESENIIQLHKRKSSDEKVIAFQKMADDLFIVSTLMGCKPQELKLYKSFTKFLNETELSKAMTTTGSGSGAEWVPTDFSAELIDLVTLELRVAALFPRINMPSDPFKIPGKTSFSTARLGVQSSAPTASSVGTSQIVLSAIKLIDWVPISYELDEDSIIAMLPIVKQDIADSIARAQENATLNGDTTATHMDSDTTGAENQLKAWKGLRKLSIANSYTLDLSTFTADKLNDMMVLMGKFGATPSKLAWIVGTKGQGKFRMLKDASGNPLMTTIDKLGPRATILTGMVGELFGAPVITSEFIREDLNASGVYDGTTKTYTCLHLVRTDGFLYGDRRKMMVETFRDVKAQNIDIVASARMAFEPRYAVASNKIVYTGIKIS